MSEINLKKLLTRKEVAFIIRELIDKTSVAITDTLGNLILGEIPDSNAERFPIKVAEEVLVGWIMGNKQVEAFMPIVAYIINQELEKKTLAQEVLNKYQEINLFYRLSEKIASILELEVVVKLVIEEARKLIKTSNGSIMLLNQNIGMLEVISAFGSESCSIPVMPGRGIAGYIFSTGIAEIVNDVLSDNRFIPTNNPIGSIICAPLKTRDKVIGIIIFSNKNPVTYTAADLKLFSALAGQAAKAIENALLYTEKEEYTRNLEQKVKERTLELHHANLELSRLANLDGLTQIANRRRFDEYLTIEWQRHLREQEPLALIMMDIDYFKYYNDYYGHQCGDDCLIQVAQAISLVSGRRTDLVARYGGEEFTALFGFMDDNSNI